MTETERGHHGEKRVLDKGKNDLVSGACVVRMYVYMDICVLGGLTLRTDEFRRIVRSH